MTPLTRAHVQWLAHVKEGDEVRVWSPEARAHVTLAVARVTAREIVTDDDRRWRRSDGQRIGPYYGVSLRLMPPKAE